MRVAAFHESRVLTDDELGPPLDSCALCGGDELTEIVDVQTEPAVKLRRCARCGACGVSRLPTPAALDRYYGGYYDASEGPAVTMDDPGRLGISGLNLTRQMASELAASSRAGVVLMEIDPDGPASTAGAGCRARFASASAAA